MKTNQKTNKKAKKPAQKKEAFNLYRFMNKNQKTIVGTVCMLLVLTMVIGLFAQMAFSMR
ncbi:MAG: hypothetical protein ACRCW2_02040 [Cellulosilyticaceae bacterium]